VTASPRPLILFSKTDMNEVCDESKVGGTIGKEHRLGRIYDGIPAAAARLSQTIRIDCAVDKNG
jgi:hypothetical protein